MIRSYKFAIKTPSSTSSASIPGLLDTYQGAIAARSISFADFAALEEVGDRVGVAEEFINTIIELLKTLEEPVESKPGQIVKKEQVKVENIEELITGENAEEATGNMLALIPLLAENLVKYEGVGLPGDRKSGLHKLLLDRGIDAKTTRMLRRLVLNVMNWTTRLKTVNGRRIVVLDDSMSVIKVSPTLKNPSS